MDLGHIHADDRKILYGLGVVATLLMVGLTASGIWQFFNHTPKSSLSGYVVGLGSPPSTADSTGVAWAHGFLGDLAGILTLFGGAWFMLRVIHRFSWFSVVSLLVIIFGLITGGVIRFNASALDGVVDVTTRGYPQFFTGDADLAVTDRFEIGRTWLIIWTVAHVLSVPVLVASSWFTLSQARRRRAAKKSSGPTWIQSLESKRALDH